MAAGFMFSMCCRRYPSFNLLRCSRFFSLPCLREVSLNVRPSNAIKSSRRLPRRTQIARYYVKPKERKGPSARSWIVFGAVCVAGAAGTIVYIGWPEEGNDGKSTIPYSNEPLPLGYICRARDKVKEAWEIFSEPSSTLLLPDPLSEPYYQPPYTLVLEMTDVLIHPEYDRKSGWRFRKRPGVDAFLAQCRTPVFEVVVYSHENGFGAAPVLEGLDPNGFIMYRLFRDATKYSNGTHVKDLDSLNRDLSKVIMIDCDPKATAGYERNTILLKKWEGDATDQTLAELAPLLLAIATSNVDDVRTVLDYYRGEEDVVEAFKRNQAKLREQQIILNQKQKEQSGSMQWGGLLGLRLFGGQSTQDVKKDT